MAPDFRCSWEVHSLQKEDRCHPVCLPPVTVASAAKMTSGLVLHPIQWESRTGGWGEEQAEWGGNITFGIK